MIDFAGDIELDNYNNIIYNETQLNYSSTEYNVEDNEAGTAEYSNQQIAIISVIFSIVVTSILGMICWCFCGNSNFGYVSIPDSGEKDIEVDKVFNGPVFTQR